jgi:DNA modification methylase
MVEWNDPRVLVAIYAAVVATVSLAWNITVSIRKNVRKIKVKVNHQMVFAQNSLTGGYTPAVGVLGVQATNYTNEDVYIKGWTIKSDRKIKIMGVETDEFAAFDPHGGVKYPYLLKKGEVFKDNSGVRSIINKIGRQLAPNSKMHVIVSDTFEKKFKSKKFKYQSILTLLETEEIDLKKYH